MLALYRYDYDYYEFEGVVAVSNNKDSLVKYYNDKADKDCELIDIDKHEQYRDVSHYCIDKINYIE
jgi:hypothetical protein